MLQKRGRTDLMYEEVRSLCDLRKGRQPKRVIPDKNGIMLTDPNDIKERRKEDIDYRTTLFQG